MSELVRIQKQRFIGIAGPIGSGKTTIAGELRKRLIDADVVPFAAPIKRMLSSIAGIPHSSLWGSASQKEEPLDVLYGKSAREALQSLGTEWGRAMIGENFWVDTWLRLASSVLSIHIIADDVRFQNEVDLIAKSGGFTVELTGRGHYSGGHSSESGALKADYYVDNTGLPSETAEKIVSLVWKHW